MSVKVDAEGNVITSYVRGNDLVSMEIANGLWYYIANRYGATNSKIRRISHYFKDDKWIIYDIMDEMMREISRYPNGTYLKVEWENGLLVIEGRIDTIYESDNGVDEDDAAYKEFYACAFWVESILGNSKDIICTVDDLIEISVEKQPTLITLHDGSIVWKK